MKPRTQAELDALFSDFYGEACAAHVEAYHRHNSMEMSDYLDWHERHPSIGRNYRRVCIGTTKTGRDMWEQEEI